MAFNITDFRTAMAYDGQRPNLFEVTITPYTGGADLTDLQWFCKGTSIPGATIGTVIVPYFGREIKLAGNRTFAEWTVTVINDETFAIRSQFEAWMNSINEHSANKRIASGGSMDYVKQATVTQFGKTGHGDTSAVYQFQNIFPTDLSEITLDWGDNDVIEEYTVTFAYDYWIRGSMNQSSTSGKQAADITIQTGTL